MLALIESALSLCDKEREGKIKGKVPFSDDRGAKGVDTRRHFAHASLSKRERPPEAQPGMERAPLTIGATAHRVSGCRGKRRHEGRKPLLINKLRAGAEKTV